jgi:hypothetical protein
VNQPDDRDEFDQAFTRLLRAADAGVRAPEGFETRLFERLERAPAFAPVPESMPWWVRAAGERHVALALLVAGLLVAWPGWWLEAASPARAATAALSLWIQQHALSALGSAFAPFSTPRVGLALAVSLAPVLVWASFGLAGAIGRHAARLALGRRA